MGTGMVLGSLLAANLGCSGSSTPNSQTPTSVPAPAGLSYGANPAVYTVGAPVTANAPTSTGGAVDAYAVSPALPAGLTLNTTTGVISGTPTAAAAQASYTVTATNASGSTTCVLVLTVKPQAPAGLSYALNPAIYTVNAAITANAPSSTGGPIASYTVSPALPAGLALDASTGVISGTPTVVVAQANYTVTATNAGGSSTCVLVLTVKPQAPAGLTYAQNPATYTLNTAITANAPSSTGGPIASYTVSPALPAGLTLDASTGVISGTPTLAAAQANYTVTATNASGSTTCVIAVTVKVQAPAGLSYAQNPATYNVNTAITANAPSSTGGPIASYAVSPALPAGLTLDASTGVISGTPSAAAAQAEYTITGTNAAGSTSVKVTLTVKEQLPAISYPSVAAFTKGTAISVITPTSSGGPVASWSVAPALPSGLSLNSSTGVISGTPTVVAAQASYTVTATNNGGSTTATLNLSVKDVPPTGLSYSANPASYSNGGAITANTPSVSGGAVVSYSVSPTLPTGLALDAATGIISGTPTLAIPSATYRVTASNSGGSTFCDLVLTITETSPKTLSYSTLTAVYPEGERAADNSPSHTGGSITSYSVTPALPAGLSLDSSTGIISGIPTAATALATYRVTGTGPGGSTSCDLTLTVSAPNPISIATFSAANSTVDFGQSTMLNWTLNTLPSALSLDGNGKPLGLAGSESVNPVRRQTYTLVATNGLPSTDTKTVKVAAKGLDLVAGDTGGVGAFDGNGAAARFYYPGGVAVDKSGNTFVAEVSNHTIRKIDASGKVTTIAGSASVSGNVPDSATLTATATGATARFNNPTGILFYDDGSTYGVLYVGDVTNQVVRKLTTTNGVDYTVGNASAASAGYPTSLAINAAGNTLYFAHNSNTGSIKSVNLTTGAVAVLAGSTSGYSDNATGTSAKFKSPFGIAIDNAGAFLYVAEGGNHAIRKVSLTSPNAVTTFAGIPTTATSGFLDATGTAAKFNGLRSIVRDASGNLYVSDYGNHAIRKIDTGGVVTTVAGAAAVSGVGTKGTEEGTGTSARFNSPYGLCLDGNGNVVIADYYNHTIRKMEASSATVSTMAGTAAKIGLNDGVGAAARFNSPNGVAVDAGGNAYVVDNGNYTVRKVTPAGAVTTVAGTAGVSGTDATHLKSPWGVAVDQAGNLYISDIGTSGAGTVRKVATDGTMSTLYTGSGFYPYGIAVSKDGSKIYVGNAVSTSNPTCKIQLLTFNGTAWISTDQATGLNLPRGLALSPDEASLFIAINTSTVNKVVKMATAAGFAVSDVATFATGDAPWGLALNAAGNLYVALNGSHVIKRIDPTNAVSTVIGSPTNFGIKAGNLTDGRLSQPQGLAVNADGDLLVVDNNGLLQVTAP